MLVKILKIPRRDKTFKIIDSEEENLIGKTLQMECNGLINLSHYYDLNTAGVLFDTHTGEPVGFFEFLEGIYEQS